jgi:hypothetical protein
MQNADNQYLTFFELDVILMLSFATKRKNMIMRYAA